VHGHDDAWPELAHDGCGFGPPDRRSSSDRHEEKVHVADRIALLRSERRLADVAEVAVAEAV
jgi:hypothetical protein